MSITFDLTELASHVARVGTLHGGDAGASPASVMEEMRHEAHAMHLEEIASASTTDGSACSTAFRHPDGGDVLVLATLREVTTGAVLSTAISVPFHAFERAGLVLHITLAR